MDLHLQLLVNGEWRRAALLEFPEPEKGPGGACNFEYEHDYLRDFIGAELPLAAVSVRLPVAFGPVCRRSWPAFLDDLRPMGSARQWWLRRLNLPAQPASDIELLRRGAVAPVGNLRIEEALPPTREQPPRFPREAVIAREHAFLEYAAEAGAQVGGATGAGGDSPKLLLRQGATGVVWIDTWQDEPSHPDRHFLVKFARGRTERERLILRSEHVYYRALASLGIDTIPLDGLALEEGPAGPSLWMPRFDVARRDGEELRFGLESIYSLLGGEPGSWQTHQQVLEALRQVVAPEDWPRVRREYLERDLLNLTFGNSDNHGRNTALLKTDRSVRLAPVYDFAPMKMDPEGVTRTTRWRDFEVGGEVDWPALLESFGTEASSLREALHELAVRLRQLPELLAGLGLPGETLDFPGIDLRHTEGKLRKWGLL